MRAGRFFLTGSFIAMSLGPETPTPLSIRGMAFLAILTIPLLLIGQESFAGLLVIAVAGGPPSDAASVDGPILVASSSRVDPVNCCGNSHGQAFADYGVLRASASASYAGMSGRGGYSSAGRASFEDTLTISVPGKAGAQALIAAEMTFAWALSTANSANGVPGATASLRLEIPRGPSATVQEATGTRVTQSHGIVTFTRFHERRKFVGAFQVPFGSPLVMEAPITIGVPFTVRAELSVHASAYVTGTRVGFDPEPGSASALVGAMNSAYWGGITSVTIGGETISSFAVTSASGTHYLAPIPEPSTYALFLAGIAMAGFAAKRRMSLPK